MKPFLILQARPETEAADNEFAAFLDKGGLAPGDVRRIRLDLETLPGDLKFDQFAGVIIGGGPGCVSDTPGSKASLERRMEDALLSVTAEAVARDIPFLGCCYGIGLLAHHLGAEVSKARYGEPVGPVDCRLTDAARDDPLTRDLPRDFTALVGHKEAVQELPRDCVHLVTSGPCPFQMIRCGDNVYATQFHPEADSAVFELRVKIYLHKGYFPPEQADAIIAACHAAHVHAPEKILRRFVERYG